MTFKERILQRLIALGLLIISILTIPVCENDATAFVFLAPLSIYMLFTKERCIYFAEERGECDEFE